MTTTAAAAAVDGNRANDDDADDVDAVNEAMMAEILLVWFVHTEDMDCGDGNNNNNGHIESGRNGNVGIVWNSAVRWDSVQCLSGIWVVSGEMRCGSEFLANQQNKCAVIAFLL